MELTTLSTSRWVRSGKSVHSFCTSSERIIGNPASWNWTGPGTPPVPPGLLAPEAVRKPLPAQARFERHSSKEMPHFPLLLGFGGLDGFRRRVSLGFGGLGRFRFGGLRLGGLRRLRGLLVLGRFLLSFRLPRLGGFGLGFFQGLAEDVAERRAAVGRAVLRDGLLFLGDLEGLDREVRLLRAIEPADHRIELLPHLEALWTL